MVEPAVEQPDPGEGHRAEDEFSIQAPPPSYAAYFPDKLRKDIIDGPDVWEGKLYAEGLALVNEHGILIEEHLKRFAMTLPDSKVFQVTVDSRGQLPHCRYEIFKEGKLELSIELPRPLATDVQAPKSIPPEFAIVADILRKEIQPQVSHGEIKDEDDDFPGDEGIRHSTGYSVARFREATADGMRRNEPIIKSDVMAVVRLLLRPQAATIAFEPAETSPTETRGIRVTVDDSLTDAPYTAVAGQVNVILTLSSDGKSCKITLCGPRNDDNRLVSNTYVTVKETGIYYRAERRLLREEAGKARKTAQDSSAPE